MCEMQEGVEVQCRFEGLSGTGTEFRVAGRICVERSAPGVRSELAKRVTVQISFGGSIRCCWRVVRCVKEVFEACRECLRPCQIGS